MSDLVIEGLVPPMQPLARTLLSRAKGSGLDPFVARNGGARTSVEQSALYALGRHHDPVSGLWMLNDPQTHRGVVTNAKPGDAPHCHRAAVDVLLLERGKVLTLGQELPPAERARQLGLYSQLGEIGESLGLEWGGRWQSIHDYPHFQLPDWRSYPVAD